MNHIFILEDDKPLSNGIALALKSENIKVTQCYDMASAKKTLQSYSFDLLILDSNLPDGSGLDLLREIKQVGSTPVMMLTANDLETDIVSGLEMGADDYITKPFSLAVLRARVNTQLRKQRSSHAIRLGQGRFFFDFDKMEFFSHSSLIELSKTEQKLLRILVENKGITLERNTLIDRIWADGADYVEMNALSVTVKRLRDKLEDDPAKPQYIKTVYGIGYTWSMGEGDES